MIVAPSSRFRQFDSLRARRNAGRYERAFTKMNGIDAHDGTIRIKMSRAKCDHYESLIRAAWPVYPSGGDRLV